MRWWLPIALAVAACTKDEVVDDTEVPSCASQLPLDQTLVLDPDGTPTQIHAAAAVGETGIWVAYDVPASSGDFEVVVLRLGCDGAVDLAPVTLSEGAINQLDPAIAVSGDRVLVTWQSDNQTAPDNLDIHYRLLDDEGSVRGGPVELAALRDGTVSSGSAWMPAVAARLGGFALVGAWAHGDSTGFQTFGQFIDTEGALVGESWDWDLQADRGQVEPTVAVDDDGVVHAAWREDQVSGPSRVVTGRWLPDGAQPEAAAGVSGSTDGGGPRLCAGNTGTWLAFSGANGPVVQTPGGTQVSTGGRSDHQPVVAAGDGGAAVAWYRNLGGLKNDVRVAWIDDDGTASNERSLGSDAAAPYPLSLIAVGEGVFFATWQEGDSPDFFLRGQFFRP